MGTRSSHTYELDLEKPGVKLEQPSLSGPSSRRVSTLARRIHGWSWKTVRLARSGALVASAFYLPFDSSPSAWARALSMSPCRA
jgi:hypothetical protein